jgi:tRNA-uridine 2-sulfurtransferase
VYGDAVRRYALDLTRAGSAGAGAHAGRAGDAGCGDAVAIELGVRSGRVAAARFRADGCPHAVAAAAACCELVEGRGLLEVAATGMPQLERLLGRAALARPCTALALDALHDALGGALAAARLEPVPGRVVVAMSGGVDSAVALLHALEAGLAPVGATLRLWVDPQAPDGERACCSPGAVRAARDACHALGLPHVALDGREPFRETVVGDFLAGHAAGRTPNPCVRCNGAFRFSALAEAAERLGAERLVTGHYARVERRGERVLVARARDAAKDQSYMLSQVPERVLARTWFPLGEQTKAQTRAQARGAGLAAAERPESQELCFVGGGDHRRFLERHGGTGPAGEIVDADGRTLARHAGTHRFTPGQRRGIGVSGPSPLYVLSTDAGTGRVVVGRREQGARSSVTVRPGRLYTPAGRVQAKLRYRSEPVWARVAELDGGFRLELDAPAVGIAAGQAAVLYDGDAVVGAGLIAG